MNDENVGSRKRINQLNYRDWNFKEHYKKAHNLHGRFGVPLDLWADYIIQCARHYAELYTIGYNRGFIELGEKGGIADVMARKTHGWL